MDVEKSTSQVKKDFNRKKRTEQASKIKGGGKGQGPKKNKEQRSTKWVWHTLRTKICSQASGPKNHKGKRLNISGL